MHRLDIEGLAEAACNWEAKCSSRSNSRSIDFLPACIFVKTLTDPGVMPDLTSIEQGRPSGVGLGCALPRVSFIVAA
jgi:hypothetical protein